MVDDFSTEDEQCQHRQERQARRQNRPAQRLIDAVVHDRFQIIAPADFQIFPDPVENDDRIVDRVAYKSQQGGDHGQVDLAIENRK